MNPAECGSLCCGGSSGVGGDSVTLTVSCAADGWRFVRHAAMSDSRAWSGGSGNAKGQKRTAGEMGQTGGRG